MSRLTRPMAQLAIKLTRPAIEQLLNDRVLANRYAGHLRVSTVVDGAWVTLTTCDFGRRAEWEHPYERHATGKEQISQRTGLSSHEVQALHPELTVPGDTIYAGSAISRGKAIVVAYSGIQSYLDRLIAEWVLAACLALITHDLESQKAGGAEFYA
jgi:hypothetical protein